MTRHTLVLLFLWAAPQCNLSAEPFSLGSRTSDIPERGKVTFAILRTEKSETSFLPPAGWKADVEAKEKTITWTSPDYQSMIRLKIIENGGDQPSKPRAEELKEAVARQFTDAKVNEEFPCFTSGAAGLGLDCEHVAKGQFVMASRLALVPIPGGSVQFNLTTPKDQFVKRQTDFNHFLNSFRIENSKSPSP